MSAAAMSDAPEPEKRKLTEKEIAARRANSTKSTGPRSVEGKDRVRRNALQHGAYARKVPWIRDGPLAEDPEEVVTFHAAVVEELAPETPLQWSMAEDIAGLAWRQHRAQSWENQALETLASDQPADTEVGRFDYVRWLDSTNSTGARVLAHLDDEEFGASEYESAASIVYCGLPDGTRTPEWDPDAGIRPPTSAAWCALIERLIGLGWSSRKEAVADADAKARRAAQLLEGARHASSRVAARAILTDPVLTKAVDMQGRLRRDLGRALEEYRKLRKD